MDTRDERWAQEYVLLIKNRQSMSETFQPMIYFLFDCDVIVYIGQSRSGLARIQSHASNKKYTHFTWIPCPVHLLNNTEAYYIRSISSRSITYRCLGTKLQDTKRKP